MNLNERVQQYEEDSKLLEQIATAYPAESPQYEVIKRAAIALWFALTETYGEFSEFLQNYEKDLSSDQRQHLKALGIDPDADSS